MSPPFLDLAQMPEAVRIALMGKMAEDGKTIGFFVDNEAKADHYIALLKESHPRAQVLFRGPEPKTKSYFVKLGPIAH